MYCVKSESFADVFSTSSNIVSCAKKGTSYQLLPSLSTHDKISITFGLPNTTLSYLTAEVKLINSSFTSPLIALTLFFNKYFVGTLESVSKIETVVGSNELEYLKFTLSINLKVFPVVVDFTFVASVTLKA